MKMNMQPVPSQEPVQCDAVEAELYTCLNHEIGQATSSIREQVLLKVELSELYMLRSRKQECLKLIARELRDISVWK